MTRAGLRWLPAAVVPAVIAVGALAVPLQAGASVDLPEKSPQDVLALAADSSVDHLSGTIEQASRLGLPELPEMSACPGQRSSDGPGHSRDFPGLLDPSLHRRRRFQRE